MLWSMLFCSSNELFTQTDQFISRFRRDEHTVTSWSHVGEVFDTIHVLHVLATPVLVTRYCELFPVETRDVSHFVPRHILQLGGRRYSAVGPIGPPPSMAWYWVSLDASPVVVALGEGDHSVPSLGRTVCPGACEGRRGRRRAGGP